MPWKLKALTQNVKTLYREIPAYKWNVPVAAFGIALAVFSITYRILVALKVIEPFISNII